MDNPVTFTLDTSSFDSVLQQYSYASKKSMPEIVNKKAFFIARRSVIETPAVTKETLAASLGTVTRRKVKGKIKTKVRLVRAGSQLSDADLAEVPLAALIVNARLGRKGLPGLFGAAMAEAVAKLISARNKSRAFLKSGWLPAIKKLELVLPDKAGAPRAPGREVQQIGIEKGSAKPASEFEGWKAAAIITNAADAKHDKQGSLIKYGGPALQRAFDFERASMIQYMEKKLAQEARKLGIEISGQLF